MSAKKNIALVAHDSKKPALIELAVQHEARLAQHNLFATGTTGTHIQSATTLNITCFESGPLGGDQQLGAQIVAGNIDLLIFYWDPLKAQPHDPDVRALLRIAVVWDIAVACNPTTAQLLLAAF